MRITKCDICKKSIAKTAEIVNVSIGLFRSSFDICADCAKPILKVLENKKLIEKNGKQKK